MLGDLRLFISCNRYLSGFTDLTPLETNLSATAIALAPKAAVPVQAPVAAPVSSQAAASPQSSNITQIGNSGTPVATIPAGFVSGSRAPPVSLAT